MNAITYDRQGVYLLDGVPLRDAVMLRVIEGRHARRVVAQSGRAA